MNFARDINQTHNHRNQQVEDTWMLLSPRTTTQARSQHLSNLSNGLRLKLKGLILPTKNPKISLKMI